MSTYDLASWRCDLCGERITAEMVVDPEWWQRVEEHKAWHVKMADAYRRAGDLDAAREHGDA